MISSVADRIHKPVSKGGVAGADGGASRFAKALDRAGGGGAVKEPLKPRRGPDDEDGRPDAGAAHVQAEGSRPLLHDTGVPEVKGALSGRTQPESGREPSGVRECCLALQGGPSVELRVFRVGDRIICVVSGDAPAAAKNRAAEEIKRRVGGVRVCVDERGRGR